MIPLLVSVPQHSWSQRTACGSLSFLPPADPAALDPTAHPVWEQTVYALSHLLSSSFKLWHCSCVFASAACTFGVWPKKLLPDPTSQSLYCSFGFCYCCFVLKTVGKYSTTELHPQTLKVPCLYLHFCNYWLEFYSLTRCLYFPSLATRPLKYLYLGGLARTSSVRYISLFSQLSWCTRI